MTKKRQRQRRSKTLHPFWQDGFSIDESRVSVLLIILLAFSACGIYLAIMDRDVPSNMVQVIMGLAAAVAGVNIAESFANRSTSKDISYTGYEKKTIVSDDASDVDVNAGRLPDSDEPTI